MITQFSADLADYAPAGGTWLWGATRRAGAARWPISPGLIALLLAAAASRRMVRPIRLPASRARAWNVLWAGAARRGPALMILPAFVRLTDVISGRQQT